MQGTDHRVPETNHIPRVYGVVAVLYLQFVLHVMLFRMLNMDVFCSFLISDLHDMLFRYCLVDFDLVPAAPVITGINFCFLHSTFADYYCWGGVSKMFVVKLPSFSLPVV